MANQEIVVTLRLSEGNTRQQFRDLKAALVDVKDEITQNNKALRENAKAQRELDKAVAEGKATQEQAEVRTRQLKEERDQLKIASANLAQSEAALSAQYREVRNDVAALTSSGQRFRDVLAQSTLEALKQSGIFGQLGARTEFLKTEMNRLNTELQEGKLTQEQFVAASNKVEAELGQLATKTTELQGKIDRLNKEFNEGKITQEEFRAQMSQINTSVDGVSSSINKGVADLKSFALGFVGVTALAQGAIAAIGSIVDTISEFDQALANVRALGGEYAASINEIGDAAIALGPKLGVAPVEALKGFEALAKAGLTTQQILSGGLEASLTLAAAGELEVADAAEITAAALTQFNLAGEDAGQVTDLLAKGANIAQGSAADFGAALNQSGLVASQFGLSIEETVGGLTAFAKAGLIGSDAGTSFRSALLRLQNPTEESKALLEQYGIELTNSKGEFLGLSEIAGQLQTKLGGLTEEQRGSTLATIFGQDAIRVANILYREGADGINKYTKEVNDSGFASGVAAEKLNSLNGDVSKLSASFDALVLSVEKGDGVFGRLSRGATQALTTIINLFNDTGTAAENALSGVSASLQIFGTKEQTDAFAKYQQAYSKIADQAKQATEENKRLGLATAEDLKARLTGLSKEFGDSAEFNKVYSQTAANVNAKLKEAGDDTAALTRVQREYLNVLNSTKDGTTGQAIALAQLEAVNKRIATVQEQAKKSSEEAATAAGVDAEKQVKSAESVSAARIRLNEELTKAKEERDALSATDTNGIAVANRDVAAIEAQIAALDGKTKKSKEAGDAERDRQRILEEITKAEQARALQDLTPVQQEEQKALTTRDDRVAKAGNDAALLLKIEEEYQAQLASIRATAAEKQVADQDKLDAQLLARKQELLTSEYDALVASQNQQILAAGQSGADLNALLATQSEERKALRQQIEGAAVEQFLVSADAEYLAAEQQGLDLQALTITQEEQLAALRQSFRDQELVAQQGQLQAEQAIQDARVGAIGGFGAALQQLSAQGSVLAKVGLALEKGAAIADIILKTQREIAGYYATYSLVPGGAAIASGFAAAAKTRAGVSIGLIAAQTIAGFDEGGHTGPGHRLKPAGIVHAGEWVAPQWQVNSPKYRPLIDFLESERRARGSGSLPYADGGLVTNAVTLPSVTQLIQIQNSAAQQVAAERPVIAKFTDFLKMNEEHQQSIQLTEA